MVFHARKWGWKRIAANLLLVPLFSGASAAVAHAQYNPVPPQAAGAKLPAPAPTESIATSGRDSTSRAMSGSLRMVSSFWVISATSNEVPPMSEQAMLE